MTSIDVSVTVDADALLKSIEGMREAVSNGAMWDFLEAKVHPYLQNRIDQRFASEGDDASGKWEALAFNTGRIRASKGFPAWHPINKRTGDLHEFVRGSYRLQGGDGVTMTLPDGGTREQMNKLRIAQQGGHVPSGKGGRRGPNRPAPARPVLAIGRRDVLDINHDLMEQIRLGGGW